MSTAAIFPGQGSQAARSGVSWKRSPGWALVEQASTATGVDVAHLLVEAEADELVDTANAQLSTYVLSLVVHHDAVDRGLEFTHFAGHSLGEYTALTAAGVIGFEDGCRLVHARGQAMRGAAKERPGTMAAIIGLDVAAVIDACAAAEDDEVWVANDNAPGQVVIAGTQVAIDQAGELAKERGARKPMPLPLAGAFHTPLMASAQGALDTAIHATEFRGVDSMVWANVDANAHSDPANWPALLSDQLCQPVQWRTEVLAMAAHGVERFIELGPGSVLTGMVKRIVPDAALASAASPDEVAALV